RRYFQLIRRNWEVVLATFWLSDCTDRVSGASLVYLSHENADSGNENPPSRSAREDPPLHWWMQQAWHKVGKMEVTPAWVTMANPCQSPAVPRSNITKISPSPRGCAHPGCARP